MFDIFFSKRRWCFSYRLGHFLRVGINPTPTETKCYNHADNLLIANILRTYVGAGFIPALPAADKTQSKCPAAARVGITSRCGRMLQYSNY
jgi:hypothetical protein